jgi:dihydrofolate reductase
VGYTALPGLHVAVAMSWNGCIAPANTDPTTFTPVNPDLATHQADLAQLRQLRNQMAGVIMGHNTYRAYPKVQGVDRATPPLVHVVLTSKGVLTSTGVLDATTPLLQQTHHPVIVNPGHDLAGLYRQLLSTYGGPWLVVGGGQTIQGFWNAGLVDYLHLTVCPQWWPNGVPLFPAGLSAGWTPAGAEPAPMDLTLKMTPTMPPSIRQPALHLLTVEPVGNAVVLRYRVEKAPA